MTATLCPCVACELDREHNRPQYRLRLDEQGAPLVGPNHPTGRCQRVEVKR